MSRAGKIVLVLLGGMIGVLLLVAVAVYAVSESRAHHVYNVKVRSVTVPTGEAALAEGKRLFFIRGCADCHGNDGGGKFIFESPMARGVGANLTTAMPTLTDDDVVRAIRHGLRKDGTPLMFMPAKEYRRMADDDIGHLIAFMRTLPKVTRDLPPSKMTLVGRFFFVNHINSFFSAEEFNHDDMPPQAPNPTDTVEYGEYLSGNCVDCHGKHFSGGPIAGAEALGNPGNLTPHETGLRDWTLDQFRTTLRTGVNPSGKKLNPNQMPWPSIGQMNDVEISALWKYLRTLPPIPHGNR